MGRHYNWRPLPALAVFGHVSDADVSLRRRQSIDEFVTLVKPDDAANAPPAGATTQRLTLTLRQHWLAGAPLKTLYAVVQQQAVQRRAAISDQPFAAGDDIVQLAAQAGVPALDLDQPLPLHPVTVAKPWGRELWLTGMESRGVSGVGSADAHIPLPWLLALDPQALCGGRHESLLLLKILDPHVHADHGDLYFELHREKHEVYVVTHVDPRAWPDEVGGMRYGMRARLRRELGDEELREAYLQAVTAYEVVRRDIDRQLDAQRAEAGLADADVVPVGVVQGWLADVPKALRDSEETLRQAMESFANFKPLRVGDVVSVQPLVPHSLQHGVRVVEFQSPVYERLILSFNQKVLTQPHWDTAEGVRSMRLDAPATTLEILEESPDVRVERIASFVEFVVWRVRLVTGGVWRMPRADYSVCMALSGSLQAGALPLAPEQACFVPGPITDCVLRNTGDDDALALLAIPQR